MEMILRLFIATLAPAFVLAACATTDGRNEAALEAPARVASADQNEASESRGYDPDAIRCRRQAIPGTRARYQEICATEREWRMTSEQSQEGLTTLQRRQTYRGED
jgi:hypothetical protein